jgi:hypothetical protein
MARMPSQVSHDVSRFDRFAGWASATVSRAWFFTACLLLVILWVPSYWLVGSLDTWQLIINTVTTIITFLLVALLQNSQERSGKATQHKTNAMAAGLVAALDALDTQLPHGQQQRRLRRARAELVAAVGLEDREES